MKKKGVFGKLVDLILLVIVLIIVVLYFFGPKMGLNKVAEKFNWIADKYMPTEPTEKGLTGEINVDSRLQANYDSLYRKLTLPLNNGKCFLERIQSSELKWDSSEQTIRLIRVSGGTEIKIINSENAEKTVQPAFIESLIPCVVGGEKATAAFCTQELGGKCKGAPNTKDDPYMEVDMIELKEGDTIKYNDGKNEVEADLGFGLLLYAADENHRCFVASEGNAWLGIRAQCEGGEKGLKEKCKDAVESALAKKCSG